MAAVSGPGRTFVFTSIGQQLGAVVAKVHRHDLKASRDSGLERHRYAVRRPIRLRPIALLVEISRDLGDPLRIRSVRIDNIHLVVAQPVRRERDSATIGAEGRTATDPFSTLDQLRASPWHRIAAGQWNAPERRPAVIVAARVDDAVAIR